MDRQHIPSFSSTLLDVIYQSVDESEDHTKTTMNTPSIDRCFSLVDKQIVNSSSKNITYSCSEFSSSSEAERIYGFPARLRPVRTSINEDDEIKINTQEINRSTNYQIHQHEDLQTRSNCEERFVKTKSKAMKIFRYLKKGTEPISPGGRFASFFISLFSTKNVKKSKIPPHCEQNIALVHADKRSNAVSSSSRSRSCLNQSPSSVTTNTRFYPATVNIGDRSDSPVVKLSRNSIEKQSKMHLSEKNRRIEETTRNLLKKYQKKVEYVFDSIKSNGTNREEDEDDDETGSYASSDLFELDHLSTIGVDRCMQELPLYETTSVHVNRAIANGLLA